MAGLNGEELEKLNRELEESKRRLEELNHFKNHLLSLASHQVRAPLAAIKGYAEILRDGLYGEVNEKVKETLERIELAADDLIKLVSNILDLKKVEEGKMDYDFSEIDLRKTAQDAVESLHPLALYKKLDLSFRAEEKEFRVRADAQKLRHVVVNLVDNAIKYTPSGFVKASVKETGGDVVFSVEDSGIGIPAGVKPLLFEEYVHDERVSMENRGSGIGLHIAKSIVEAHGGKIWCASGGEGKGSTFYFSLPKID